VAANVPAARAAARTRPVSARYTAKSAGVSLIPAAMPVPTPFQRLWSGSERSASTRSRRTRFTWPSSSVRLTGSSQTASAQVAAQSAAFPRPAPGRHSHTAASRHRSDTAVSRNPTPFSGRNVSGTKRSAANAVYVNAGGTFAYTSSPCSAAAPPVRYTRASYIQPVLCW